jgi:hypothetical protein
MALLPARPYELWMEVGNGTGDVLSTDNGDLAAYYSGFAYENFVEFTTQPADSDGDGILDDGDDSGDPNDNPCADGVTEDCDDNCPYVPNNSAGDVQTDTDLNGLGNVCQCGDVNGDGRNNFIDARLILFPGVFDEAKCDVNGDGACNFIDARLILLGQVSSEHEDQLCPAYQGL